MKKLFLLLASLVLAAGIGFSQNYIVVNSETIFRSIDEFNEAVEELDSLARHHQQNIDDAFARIEEQYNTYMQQQASLSQSARQQREQTIINNEQRVAEYQESIFGSDGTLAQLQRERLEPIQSRVIETIASYALQNQYDLVIDIATNPTILFHAPALDKTEQIIELLQ